MSGFSPDGLWWWNGGQWIPTAEAPLALPVTEFERSGKLRSARRLIEMRTGLFIAMYVAGGSVIGIPLLPIFLVAYMVVQYLGFKAFRQWTLELLAVATAQLMGPEEPMLAGETMLWSPTGLWPRMQRDIAVAVTRSHVLLYQFDTEDGPPSRVVFAARSQDAELRFLKGVIWLDRLVVIHAGRWWVLRGIWGAFDGRQAFRAWSDGRQEQLAVALAPDPARVS